MRRAFLRLLLAILLPVAALGVAVAGAAGSGTNDRDGDRPGPRRSVCGCAHACGAVSYQGCGCGSISCFPGGDRLRGLVQDAAAQAALSVVTDAQRCTDGLAAGQFPCQGVDLQSYVPLAMLRDGAASGSSLWGFVDLDDGREYAVFGLNNGTSVVDVTEPARPVVVGSVDGPVSIWREVKVYQVFNREQRRYNAYAYVVSEASGSSLQILDLSDLPRQVTLAATYRLFDSAHTVFMANADTATGAAISGLPPPVLYVQGPKIAGIVALDLTDPVAPTHLGSFSTSYGHDIWAGVFTGERAQACRYHDPCEVVVNWAGDAIRIVDWTHKALPETIAELRYPNLGYAHSGWITADGLHLLSMDEQDEIRTGANSLVRVIDISDLRRPLVVGGWQGPTRAIEHNGYTRGEKFYIAHYERGLTILDVANPLQPREVATFDTYPLSENPSFHGAWGVYPYLPSGNILLSNIDGAGGLFVLKETAGTSFNPGDNPRAPVHPVPGRGRPPRTSTDPR
jgi:choice-of-anchor B domain-containing protein